MTESMSMEFSGNFCSGPGLHDLLYEDHGSVAAGRMCSNFAFIVNGFLGGLYPVLILHAILLPLNGLRLHQMHQLTKRVREAA
jgi:hypothetical protein